MKLKTYLNKLNETDIVSIGTKDGVGYMYIGEAGNVEKILNAFESIRNSAAVKLEEARALEVELANQIPDGGYVHEYARNIANCYRTIEAYRKYLTGYVDPFKRDVCDDSIRIAEDGVRIIVTGSEKGNFWFKDEYDKQRG